MKEYEKLLNKNNVLVNKVALNVLLQNGRENIKDDQYYEKMLNTMEEGIVSINLQKEAFEIARNMAKMSDKDLCEFIHDSVKFEKRQEKDR